MTKFTGGDSLQGVEKFFHLAMNANELANGEGAYKLTWAALGNSGISFGGNQMDLSSNRAAMPKLLAVLSSQKDSVNHKIFSDDELKHIEEHGRIKGVAPKELFGLALLTKINLALSSAVGMQRINQFYIEEIHHGASFINGFVLSITNRCSRVFYEQDLGKTLLFDYHNQFGLTAGGLLNNYLNGATVTMSDGVALRIGTEYNIADHVRFLCHTKYGTKNRRDIGRRIKNIIHIPDLIPVAKRDDIEHKITDILKI